MAENEKRCYLTVRKVDAVSQKTGNPYTKLIITLEDGSLDKYEFPVFLNNEQVRILQCVPSSNV